MRSGEELEPGSSRPQPARSTRWLLVAGLLVLSPVCAEYLVGYDDSTGQPLALLGNLVIFVPLYGAPALLIRETARRTGMRWPGILALATAAGVVQAGVIDQSLFSESYRQIGYWEEILRPTFVAPLGLSAHLVMIFLAGHAVWSFGVPIALVEGLRPDAAHRPWLRLPGLVVTALLYLAAAAVVLRYHLQSEVDHASAGQIAGALVVTVLLVVSAFTAGRRPRRTGDGAVPGPLVVAAATFVVAVGFNLVPSTWAGTAVGAALLVAAAVAVARLSRSPRWDGRHVVALAAGAATARAATGFLVEPLGAVAPLAQYAHHTVAVLGAVLLGLWAVRRNRRAGPVSRAPA